MSNSADLHMLQVGEEVGALDPGRAGPRAPRAGRLRRSARARPQRGQPAHAVDPARHGRCVTGRPVRDHGLPARDPAAAACCCCCSSACRRSSPTGGPSRREDACRVAAADRMRLATHLLDLAVRQDAAKEIRVFGLQDEIGRRLGEIRGGVRREFFGGRSGGRCGGGGRRSWSSPWLRGRPLLVVRGAVEGQQSVGDVVLVVTLATRRTTSSSD